MSLKSMRQDGFTLVEVTIILLVLVIISTIMLPQLGNYNRLARVVKTQEDVSILCAQLKKMLDEAFENGFWGIPSGPLSNAEPVGLLFGDGLTPGSVAAVAPGTGQWDLPAGVLPEEDCFSEVQDNAAAPVAVDFHCDTFDNHLITNTPMNGAPGLTFAPTPYNDPTSPGIVYPWGWHGPYLNRMSPDGWGNRYVANVFGLHEGFTSPIYVVSAGPNQSVETVFNQAYVAPGVTGLAGDDFGCVLSAGGPM